MNNYCDHHDEFEYTPYFRRLVSLWIDRKVELLSLLTIPLLSGCFHSGSELRVAERYENGYVIILPGIEGKSYLNENIAQGLAEGGVKSAIEIYDWTAFRLLSFPVNLRYLERNKRQAREIATKIIHYQDRYPGKPIHLIGHSGGGGIALLAMEALPYQRTITSTILLAAAVAPRHDLRRALRRSEHGIWNFYSPHDVGFLKWGTTVMGTIEGDHTTAAGAVGFSLPWGLDREGRMLYGEKLHQQRYNYKMADSGHSGGHFGWANKEFVSEWLAPLINSQMETHVASKEPEQTKANVPAVP